MAVDSFTNLVPWQGGSVDISPYIKWFVKPDATDSSRLLKVHRFDNDYFQTMVVRLHSFDGSMALPGTVDYVQYDVRLVPAPVEIAGNVNGYARVITNEKLLDVSRGLTGSRLSKRMQDSAPGNTLTCFPIYQISRSRKLLPCVITASFSNLLRMHQLRRSRNQHQLPCRE